MSYSGIQPATETIEFPIGATADDVERAYSLRVLEREGGNKAAAARVLGFDRRTLYRKLQRWEAGK